MFEAWVREKAETDRFVCAIKSFADLCVNFACEIENKSGNAVKRRKNK